MGKMEKVNGIGLLIMVILFLLGLKEILLISGALDNKANMRANEFWWQYCVILAILSIIGYIIMFHLPKVSEFIYTEETKEQKDHIKNVSNDLFFVFFFFGFLVYGLPVQFRNPNDLVFQYYQFYLYFVVIGIAYIIFAKVEKVFSMMKKTEEKRKKAKLIELGSITEYAQIIITVFLGFLLMYLVSYFLPLGTGIFSSAGRDLLLFQIFGSIPAEELVFRGMGMLIFTSIFREIIFDIKNVPELDRDQLKYQNVEKGSQYIAIIITSTLFGIFHVWRYGYNLWVIVYLTILGFILGFAYYKHSLFAAFLLHVANNISAEKSAVFTIIDILINPYFYLIIGLTVLVIILIIDLVRKHKR
jgi:membrane protease YdiL (CAAX protease family)